MKRKNLVLLILFSVLLCFAVLRETGVVDVNLYKSYLSTSQSSSMTNENPGKEKRFSYQLTFKDKNEAIHNKTHVYNDLPPIEIEARLEDPVYTGNYIVPLVKNFKMIYHCEFNTTKSPSGQKVSGVIAGQVKAKIYGLCSRKKTKKLAFEGAKKQIVGYFQQQLDL